MRSLGSDNHSGVHPKILEALVKANVNHDASYGTDKLSKELGNSISKLFGEGWNWFHCFNGTAANVLSLKTLIQSHHSVICSDVSHLHVDECGAPEFHIGCKLITVESKDGKITADQIKENLVRLGDQHFSQAKAVSITQPTELGTCYSLDEIESISKVCKENNLFLHIDGARLANSVYSLKTTLKDVVKLADSVSVGGTKNGLLGSELVLVKKEFSKNFKFIRKQSMQLPSKTRFLAAQFIEYFKDDLYLKIAKHSCEAALLLKEELRKVNVSPNYPVQSNALFINFTKEQAKSLRKEMFFYIWDEHTYEARLMTSFNTTNEELLNFSKKVAQTAKELPL